MLAVEAPMVLDVDLCPYRQRGENLCLQRPLLPLEQLPPHECPSCLVSSSSLTLPLSSACVFLWGLYVLLSLWSMPQVSRKVFSSAEMYCGPPFEVSISGARRS